MVKKLSIKKFKKILSRFKFRELLSVFIIVDDWSDFKLLKKTIIKGEINTR